MNNLRLNLNISDLSDLHQVGEDTYELVAKFFKQDGTPLGNSNIPDEYPATVFIDSLPFTMNVPIANETYNIPNVKVRVYSTVEAACCIARLDNVNIVNVRTEVSVQAVLMNQLTTGKVFRYEPSNNETIELFTAANSSDIAHTTNRLFILDIGYETVSGQMESRTNLREYTINLNPFSQSKGPDYLMPIEVYGAGLHAVSNTELYVGGENLTAITISGGVATPTVLFALPTGYQCTGDLIYDPATQLFLMTYDDATNYRIGVFQRNGTIVRNAAAPVNNLFGMYQYQGVTYVVDGTGQIYSLDLTTLATTPTFDTNIQNAGASQIQSNISIPA